MTFQDFAFDPRLQAGIAAMGFTQPTPIQSAAIPEVAAGRDVIGVAQTGTGKTAAFMLPILQRLLDHPRELSRGAVRALVLAPTRELAEQICLATREMARQTDMRVSAVYGGVGKEPQARKLRRGVEIVVACPGRLLDIHGDGSIDLSGIEVLVLDEADRMCDMGFLPDLREILGLLPTNRQSLFFSATMPREIRGLADSMLIAPVEVSIGQSQPAVTVSQAFYPVSESRKSAFLVALLKHLGRERTLIFTKTKDRARVLALVLAREGHSVAAMQGNLTQGQRQVAMEGFRKGRYDVLVATDIAARGIDISEIETVINYDMPDTLDGYTHRVGRTGRAERTGEALSLASPADTLLVREIQDQLGEDVEQRVLPDFDYDGFTPRLFVAPREERKPAGRRGLGSRRRTVSRRRTARFA